jgi:hypothetical protein
MILSVVPTSYHAGVVFRDGIVFHDGISHAGIVFHDGISTTGSSSTPGSPRRDRLPRRDRSTVRSVDPDRRTVPLQLRQCPAEEESAELCEERTSLCAINFSERGGWLQWIAALA